ncbi:vacuole membrane protein 1-like isoform X1 [Sinocyclocheilus anshuiensis]|uniref:vacuole membrane protein 1-like isoform X1 n=1 Tax=Sinocyclocheilus anshuiensis TaxID=1608454 RepID=UPI0007B88030|nr:PREDICTED: vacuole membrane protein 1-like isoform X1 [Sinocyclocheilus anshuiensis]
MRICEEFIGFLCTVIYIQYQCSCAACVHRVYGVGTEIGEIPVLFTARAGGLSGTGPGDEACEEFAELFHSTMVRIVRSLPSEQTLRSERFFRNSYPSFYLISVSWITSGHFPKPFLEFIFSAIRKTMMKTHTEKVFVIPSASTYSGADGGPHWSFSPVWRLSAEAFQGVP